MQASGPVLRTEPRRAVQAGAGDSSGYTRASWPALCSKVGKLRVGLLDGKLLELCYDFATREKKLRNRWRNLVGAAGIERATYSV